MIRTITLGSCVSIQGQFIRKLANGKIVVKVGRQLFEGRPISTKAA